MDLTIRPYTPADYDWVLQCEVGLQEHERAIHDTRLPGLPHSRDYLAMLWDELAEGHGIMLIAETPRGERLGLVAGHIIDAPWPMETRDSTRYGYVSDIFITAEARGRGVGGWTVDAFLGWLAGVGVRSVIASVRPDNEPSLAIIRKLGFHQTGEAVDEEDGLEFVFELER